MRMLAGTASPHLPPASGRRFSNFTTTPFRADADVSRTGPAHSAIGALRTEALFIALFPAPTTWEALRRIGEQSFGNAIEPAENVADERDVTVAIPFRWIVDRQADGEDDHGGTGGVAAGA